jgi:DNA mismatch repair ATPase MutS
MAIAEAILKELLNNIGAYTLFSTHYSQLTDRFNSCNEIKLGKMAFIKSE